MNTSHPPRSLSARALTFGVAALLAAVASYQAVADTPITGSTGPNTWTNGGSDLPIWDVGPTGIFSSNWSYNTLPGPLDNVLFPNNVPTFPFAALSQPPLNTLGNGLTILLGDVNGDDFEKPGKNSDGLPLVVGPGNKPGDPNALIFQNSYTLVNASVFAPASPLFIPGTIILPITSGAIIVGRGFTATIDVDVNLLPVNGTITKYGLGALILNDVVIGNVLVQDGLLGGNFIVTGNLTNHATLSPGDAPGTIYVQGNFRQDKVASLNLKIASPTSFDQVLVSGIATLGGSVNVALLDGFRPQRGKKFTFLDTNSIISGKFDKVNAPVWDLLTLRPFYGKHTVTLKAVINSFDALPGLTPNQDAVARNLDAVLFDSRETKLINVLYGKGFDQLPGDFDKIAPEELTSIFTIGTSLATVQSLNIRRRTDDIRSGSSGFSASGLAINGAGPSYSGSFSFGAGLGGPSGNDGKESKEMKTVAPTENRWGAFLSGTGEWVNVSGTDNARGYEVANGGFTLGVDYKVCPNFAIGLMAGYTGTTADLTDHGRVWVDGGSIGLYATTFVGGWYADAAVSGGYSSYDTRRGGLQGEARGDTDGGNLNALFGTGYDFKSGGWTFGPTATFNYTYTGTNGFTETGSLAPLNIHGGEGQSVRSALGFKASYDCKVGSILLKPEIRAAWQHEYGDSAYALVSDFANGGGDNFTVNGPKLGRDSALIGAGFAIQCSERCSTYLYYDGELGRTHYQSNSVTGGVRFAF